MLLHSDTCFGRDCSTSDIQFVVRSINATNSIKADFVEHISNSISKGYITWLRPASIKMEYHSPKKILLLSQDANVMLHYDFELKEASYVPIRNTALLKIIGNNIVNLQKQLHVKRCDIDGDITSLWMSGIIMGKEVEDYENTEIKVEFQNIVENTVLSIRRIIVYRFGKIHSLLTLSNAKLNHGVNKSDFHFKDPTFYGANDE
ncbi:LolA family protein [Candidatus Fokinia crypta]|uniref:LolA family protein n=1 Tax=Candidatus Fokinia crypta TaxID=1920990 RepID=UPI002B25DC41|nr:outer-membrane lipoprotein carrier protein LolA [Candidatus Fokinia cryptica]